MKKILVLYTGGTIGMRTGTDGLLRPDTAIAEYALQAHQNNGLVFEWHVCDPLIDSAAVSPQHWAQWLALLQQRIDGCDGVLLLHGTDTLAYTANLLALALDTRGKPLVLTGAQKPLGNPGSDAEANLATAVAALLRDDIRETLIAFDGSLYPAVGSSKCSTEQPQGFANSHFGAWQPQSAAPAQNTGSLKRRFDPAVRTAALLLTPGESARAAAHLLQNYPLDAAVLLSYGHGNIPDDPMLLDAVRRFTESGRILLNISQAAQGCAAPVYAQGSALRQAGAVSGGKCNAETATALLMLAAANGWTAQDMRQELRRLRLRD